MIGKKEMALVRQAAWSREQNDDTLTDKQHAVLEGLKRGHSRRAACAITGVSQLVFDHWMRYDSLFSAAAAWAEAYNENMLVDKVNASTDWRAAVALLQSRHPESWASPEQKLAIDRASIEKQKLEANLAKSQADELATRAERNRIETSMWTNCFVTEEDQQAQIQAVAEAANRPLLKLTPEKYAELIRDKTPEEQLEVLKGYLGVEQSKIVEEVLSGKHGKQETPEEDYEDDDNQDEDEGS